MKKVSLETVMLLSIAFLCSQNSFAQIPQQKPQITTSSDSSSVEDDIRRAEISSIPYNNLQQIFGYHDPILYLSPAPVFNSLSTRKIALQDGEGMNGYWLEGNISHRVTMYRGKYYSRPFWSRARITFDAAFMLRMTKDSSSPLLPTSNDVGLGLDYLLSDVNKIESPKATTVYLKAQIHHYSNGQALPFFKSTAPNRNNYKNGDFSTNYIRLMVYGMKQTSDNHIYSAGLGLQREVDLGGPLTLSDELASAYGLNRVLLNLQWTRRSRFVLTQLSDTDKKKFSKNPTGKTVRNARTQWIWRSELAYIIDNDLSLYPLSSKYRLGVHNYLTWMPWVTSDFGFVFHNYFGRDYLNIRYDDPIQTYQLGFVMNFNKMR
ncbi:hypothetical protein [Pedobacter sp. Leaf132]|uniref:hypothetical protein n=1 Tax=Pedobacter sp. Leaf132 TaxID=2876557 RepID=UPI001E41F471|nr:hypothetical protein [Pedobacter sp. Leaf132]